VGEHQYGRGFVQQLENDFSQVIPGAGEMSEKFLGVVKNQCDAAGIGLLLHPHQPDKRKPRYVLQGNIPVETTSMFKGKGRPALIQVYADRVGTSTALTVGWQLVSDAVDDNFLRHTQAGMRQTSKLNRQDSDPDRVRQINAAVQAFHAIVFQPVMQQLADAVRPQQSAGFFNAS
jgi:hypothetical protein